MASHETPMQRSVLSGYTNETALDFSIFNKPSCDKFRGIDSGCEADALSRKDDGGIHANDFALRRHQRSPGVSRIQSSVGLDDVVDQAARLRPQRSSERADHTRGYRALKTVRVSDSNNELADPNRLR